MMMMRDKYYCRKFGDWMCLCDGAIEKQKIKEVCSNGRFEKILDVGCGNGRCTENLASLFPTASIVGVDVLEESILIARDFLHSCKNVHFITEDIFKYLNKDKNSYDLVVFSWSFFDIPQSTDTLGKKKELDHLLEKISTHINKKGILLILQPTIGGVFEKLLSKFLTKSADNYSFIHDYLLENNFTAPLERFPSEDDELAIWSVFKYSSEDDLFEGVRSIVYLETGRELERNDFNMLLLEFKKENNVPPNELLELTDCVNIYYKINGE